jgi:NADP-dependent 3-hydroxy acid dehydrogenase YdfG
VATGLGRDITEAALAAGDSVVAAARRIEELDPLVKQYGEKIKPVTLDVRDEAAAHAAVQAAVDAPQHAMATRGACIVRTPSLVMHWATP